MLHDDLASAARRFGKAIWDDRWSLGVYLGVVWLALLAFWAWWSWLGQDT